MKIKLVKIRWINLLKINREADKNRKKFNQSKTINILSTFLIFSYWKLNLIQNNALKLGKYKNRKKRD
jgi:hypothetical protein